MPKNDYVKLVIDACYLNSVTDLTNYSGPLEPVQTIITRLNGKFFSVTDLSCAYLQVTFGLETQKLTNSITGGQQYTFPRRFYGLCGLPNFFSRLMTIHSDPLIRKKLAITYIDDNIMQSQTTSERLTFINEYHTLLRKAGLKTASDKTFFFRKKVKFLGHVVSPDGIQPIAKRVDTLSNLKSPQIKRDLMEVLGCLGFYSYYDKNLHLDSQPFYDLITDYTPFHWTGEHETLLNSNKVRIHKDTVLAVPSTKYPFHNHVDSSNVGTDCILIQQFPEGKRIISFNSHVFEKAEKKCPRFIENYVDSYQLSRHTNITFSDHQFPSISIVIKNYFFFMGTQRTTITSIFPISGEPYKIPKLEAHLNARLELSFFRYPQQKCHD